MKLHFLFLFVLSVSSAANHNNEDLSSCGIITFEKEDTELVECVAVTLNETHSYRTLHRESFEEAGIPPRNYLFTHFIRNGPGDLEPTWECSGTKRFLIDEFSEIEFGYRRHSGEDKPSIIELVLLNPDDEIVKTIDFFFGESSERWNQYRWKVQVKEPVEASVEMYVLANLADWGVDYVRVLNTMNNDTSCQFPPIVHDLCDFVLFGNVSNLLECQDLPHEFRRPTVAASGLSPRNSNVTHVLTEDPGLSLTHCAQTANYTINNHSSFELGYFADLRDRGVVLLHVVVKDAATGDVVVRWTVNTSGSSTNWRVFKGKFGVTKDTQVFIEITGVVYFDALFGIDYFFLSNSLETYPECFHQFLESN